MKLQIDKTVREIAIEMPASTRVFEELGIDYCCGGDQSLEDACGRARVSTDEVLRRLAAVGQEHVPAETDWTRSSLHELIAYILERHHGYLYRETPRLRQLLEKTYTQHGPNHPELKSLHELFSVLTGELSLHMMKEENVLFPYVVRMESANANGSLAPAAQFGSVERPIACMFGEHENAGDLLSRIRTVTNNFRAPGDACTTFQALYHGLEEFERDLHQHIHLENNILFPRALQLEREQAASVGR